jgi:hypothetical protein
VPPGSIPVTPVVVPLAGLPPEPTLPPGFIPETPDVEPAAGKFPDGTLAAAEGAAAGGAGGADVVGAGGGGGGSAGTAPRAATTVAAVAIERAVTARDATPADAMVVIRMISPLFDDLVVMTFVLHAGAVAASRIPFRLFRWRPGLSGESPMRTGLAYGSKRPGDGSPSGVNRWVKLASPCGRLPIIARGETGGTAADLGLLVGAGRSRTHTAGNR